MWMGFDKITVDGRCGLLQLCPHEEKIEPPYCFLCKYYFFFVANQANQNSLQCAAIVYPRRGTAVKRLNLPRAT